MAVEIIEIYSKKEDIEKITSLLEKYSFQDLEKHCHFEFSVMEKLTDIELISRIFKRFELIKTIELRENDKKERYYSLNYEIEDGTFVSLAIVLRQNKKPLLINAIHASKNYRHFEKSLRKNYGDKFLV